MILSWKLRLLRAALFLSHSFRPFNISILLPLDKKDVVYFHLSRYNKDSMINILYEEREVKIKRIISTIFYKYIYTCARERQD